MSTAELLDLLKDLSNAERLAVIAEATRLVREDLHNQPAGEREVQRERMRKAAADVKDLYEPGGELTEWTALDAVLEL